MALRVRSTKSLFYNHQIKKISSFGRPAYPAGPKQVTNLHRASGFRIWRLKKPAVSLRDLAGLVVRDPVRLHLFRREVFRDHHRDFRPHRVVVETRILLLIRMDLREFHHLNLHKGSFPGKWFAKERFGVLFARVDELGIPEKNDFAETEQTGPLSRSIPMKVTEDTREYRLSMSRAFLLREWSWFLACPLHGAGAGEKS